MLEDCFGIDDTVYEIDRRLLMTIGVRYIFSHMVDGWTKKQFKNYVLPFVEILSFDLQRWLFMCIRDEFSEKRCASVSQIKQILAKIR